MAMKANTPSLLYSVLPLTVQSRIPRLGSLRRRASIYARPTFVEPDSSASDCSDDSATSPPSYRTSAPSSACASNDQRLSQKTQPTSYDHELAAHGGRRNRGVEWKYASQGHVLLSLATQEASSPSHHMLLSRKMYIGSVEYLLQGLPLDLTVQEEASLRCALPLALAAMPLVEGQSCAHTDHDPDCCEEPPPPPELSVLHRVVASLTLYAILLIYSILPYIQLALQQAYQYDQKHRISKRLGKQTLLLADTFCALDDGKVGEAVRDVGLWCVRGVGGGVYEGVGEGMQVLGLRPAAQVPGF